MWDHFKSNISVKQYFPDYAANEYPEKEFFFAVLNTLYPRETENLTEAAYKLRKTYHKRNEDDMIKVTNEVKEDIMKAVVYQSNLHF